mgnify:CR=1 FL=1
MTQPRTAYAWQQGDKWRLSVFPKTRERRPYNEYDTQAEVVTEAGRRGMELTWETADGGN